MKLLLCKLSVLSLVVSVWAQAPLPPEIEDPETLGINLEPPHATLMPYGSMKEALAAKRADSSFSRSLNGQWKFHWVEHPEKRPVDFYKPEFDASGWDDIEVPSCWQLLGYGTPYYRNLGYIFQKDWPRVMTEPPRNFTAFKERNPVGSYRREFEVPGSWKGRRTFITFSGVDSAFFVWVNGEKVGFAMNSRNAAEFDLTKYLKAGKNLLAVEVYRFSAGSYMEDQDMWRLSGIFRNVTLWSAPQVHIRDFSVKTDLDEKYRDAVLQVSAVVRNYGDQPAPARSLSVELHDAKGNPVTGVKATLDVPALNPGQETNVSTALPVSNPAKWTAETPNLYTTVLGLSGEAKPELLSTRTGFREIEIKGRLFTVNGVAVKLKGANRHENVPDTGHTVPESSMIRDLELLKQGNCNHVRTSHYSDDPRWYELCDEWGIYLVAEANLECHGYMNVLDREPKFRKMVVDRNVINVENFKNHASIVMWSLGNECGGGSNFVAALRAIKAIDATRPTQYEPFGMGRNNPGDVDSRMYTSVPDMGRHATNASLTKPFYLCEYAHAMFNSMGSIGEYNDLFDQYPALMGGAIWEWQDQGIWNRRDPNRQFIAFGGGFKEVPNDRYFIHKGVVFSEREPKPHYPEMKRVYQWIGAAPADLAAGTIKVRNKYAFITLEGFTGHWTLSEDGRAIQSGELPELALPPGAEQVVPMALKPFTPKLGARYLVDVSFTLKKNQRWAKAGFEVAHAQFPLPQSAPPVAANILTMPSLKITEDGTNIAVAGIGFQAVFSKASGTFSQLVRDGKNLLIEGAGPQLHLWRAPHQTDDMWAYRDWQRYGLNDLKRSVKRVSFSQPASGEVRIEAVINAEGKQDYSVMHSAVYTIYGDGSIAVDNAVTPTGRRIPWARLGVRLELAQQYDQVTYLGRGPFENYGDRKRGSDVGLYSATTRELMTPYAKPMECGNHEDVDWVAITGKRLPALMAQADEGVIQFTALPYTDEVMNKVEYSVDLPASQSTVLTVAKRTQGVGSNGCGPRPLEQYLVWSGPETFSYVLRLLPAGTKDFAPAGRQSVPQTRIKPVPENNAGRAAILHGKAMAASSFEPGEGEIGNAVDGNEATFWHSRWNGEPARAPHFLTVDYGREVRVAAVNYVARTEGENGRVRDYEIYFSQDGQTWGESGIKGSISGGALTEAIRLPQPTTARYLKFVVLSEQRNQAFASIAELSVTEAATPQ